MTFYSSWIQEYRKLVQEKDADRHSLPSCGSKEPLSSSRSGPGGLGLTSASKMGTQATAKQQANLNALQASPGGLNTATPVKLRLIQSPGVRQQAVVGTPPAPVILNKAGPPSGPAGSSGPAPASSPPDIEIKLVGCILVPEFDHLKPADAAKMKAVFTTHATMLKPYLQLAEALWQGQKRKDQELNAALTKMKTLNRTIKKKLGQVGGSRRCLCLIFTVLSLLKQIYICLAISNFNCFVTAHINTTYSNVERLYI